MRYTSEANVEKLLAFLDQDIAGVKVEINQATIEKRFWEGALYGYKGARSTIISVLELEEGDKCD